jgi:hypothetical protein
MQHLIKKQVISLTLNKKMDAFAVQHLVSEQYWQEIVPMLQKEFDFKSTEEEIISLDRVEIDLGEIVLKEIEKGRWKEIAQKKIAEQLKAINFNEYPKKEIRRQSKIISIAEQWIFYMQHGYLPWNVLQVDESWYRQVLQAFASDSAAISKLRLLIRNNSAAIRIISQHSPTFLEALLETLTARKQHQFSQFIDELSGVSILFSSGNANNYPQKKQLIQQIWRQAFQFSITEKEHFNSSTFISHLLKSNPLKQEIINDATSIDEEGIFLQNAGIVILHPFLNMFFKNLQLIEENTFLNELSQQKAMFLLHYLATGLITHEEHELVIEKILCAWPLEKPVNNLIELSVTELKEADDLLVEVIGQWKILKKTSSAGLRENFLQRNGKAYAKNKELHVQVESSSIDMLLDHLPWNLSLIKLPWMKDILRVEWR